MIPRLHKSTSIHDPASTIAGGVADAASKATSFITSITGGGIFVHPDTDATTGWRISDVLELVKSGISVFRVWLEGGLAKVRIGESDKSHILMDETSLEMVNRSGMRYFTLREDPDVTKTVMTSVYGSTLPANAVQGSTFYVTYVHGYNEEYVGRVSFTQGISASKVVFADAPSDLVISYDASSGVVNASCSAQGYQKRVVCIEYLVNGSLVYAVFGSASNLASRGNYTFSSGEGLVADSDKQTVVGRFNDNQSTNAFEVGNGTSDSNRSNAFAVDWDGNVPIAGDVQDMSGALRYAPIAYGSLTYMASALTLTTSAQKLPLGTTFVGNGCSASSNGVKVEKAGTYLILGSAYLFDGYTANDIVHLLIRAGSTEVADCVYRAPTANPYQTISTVPVVVQLAANSVVTLHAYNQVAARGTINSRTMHGLTVLRIA